MSHSPLHLKGICQLATTDHSACHSTVGASNDTGDLLWYATVSQQFSEALSVQTAKCLLIINKADVQRRVPFAWLFRMMRSVAIWCVQDLPLRNPARWSRSWGSTASFILFSSTQLNTCLVWTVALFLYHWNRSRGHRSLAA